MNDQAKADLQLILRNHGLVDVLGVLATVVSGDVGVLLKTNEQHVKTLRKLEYERAGLQTDYDTLHARYKALLDAQALDPLVSPPEHRARAEALLRELEHRMSDDRNRALDYETP